MKIYNFKIAAYRFSHTAVGKFILKMLSSLVCVKNLSKENPGKKHPFLVCITIDTESGYVKKNDERAWQYSNPEEFIGYYGGIENWRKILNKYGAKSTFFLSTNCFSAKNQEKLRIVNQLKLLKKEGHEIGLHMHPDSDLALQEELGTKFNFTSSKKYNKKQIDSFISSCKNLIYKNTGNYPESFRWGNWALGNDAVNSLESNKILIDSSATPGIKGHENDGMAFDWSRSKSHYPWKLSSNDYQNEAIGSSNVVEIPIATFNFLGLTMRADPSYPVLLNKCFDYYYRYADRSKKPFAFVVISHSMEGTHKDGSATKVISVMEDFLEHASAKKDVKFSTIKEAAKQIE